MTSRTKVRPSAVAAVGALALVLWLVALRDGFPGYDTMWSFAWGDQLVHGQLPDLDATAGAPTPHPLAIVAATVLSAFGPVSGTIAGVAASLALALLGWSAFGLGCALFSRTVGALFAAILVTRPQIVLESLQLVVDIPFLVLVLVAARVAVLRPLAGRPVLLILAAAGLLRPEAWVLSAAYVALLVVRGVRPSVGLLAIALAAPCLWMAGDLAATGDPLFSLHATRDLAALLDRPHEAGTALGALPRQLEALLGGPVIWVGLAGALVAVARCPARAAPPLVVIAVGIATFVALGVAGLPVLARYLLLPAAMLALLCAAGVAGWLSLGREDRWRPAWAAAGVAAAVVLCVSGVDDRARIRAVVALDGTRHAEQARLADSIRRPPARRAVARCGSVQVDDTRLVALVAYYAGVDPRRVRLGAGAAPSRALVVVRSDALARQPLLSHPLLDDGTWTFFARCP